MCALTTLLLGLGLCISPSPPDGHCLLHSLLSSYNNQHINLPPLTLKLIKEKVCRETTTRYNLYIPYMTDCDFDVLLNGLRKYICDKHYNHDFVDLVPQIIANAFSIQLSVLDQREALINEVRYSPVTSGSDVSHVYVLRQGMHYNGLIKCENTNNTRMSYSRDELLSIRYHNVKIKRCVRKTLFHYNLWRPRNECKSPHTELREPKPVDRGTPLKFGLLNARSLGNKTDDVSEYISDLDVDILAVTESWLSDLDSVKIGDVTPEGYLYRHVPRENRSGGGVAVISRKELGIAVQPRKQLTSMELMECVLRANGCSVRLFVIYRPPTDINHKKIPVSIFLDEFTEVVSNAILAPGHMLVTGDFNFHIDDLSDSDAMQFLHLLDTLNLEQYVCDPTHKDGHTLDLIISRSGTNFKLCQNVHVDTMISDHNAILADICLAKPPAKERLITYRKTSTIDIESFKQDLKACNLDEVTGDIDAVVAHYNESLTSCIDKHAPVKQSKLRVRPKAPWIQEEFIKAKQKRRQLERRWRRTRSDDDYRCFQDQKVLASSILQMSKTEYLSSLVNDNAHDPKLLFKTLDNLLHSTKDRPLPMHTSASELACEFATYFDEKVTRVKGQLGLAVDLSQLDDSPKYTTELTRLQEVSLEEISKLIRESPSKTCDLDPVPTWLIKKCCAELAPVITCIVNMSFNNAMVPSSFKHAIILPVLKKIILDLLHKNYRPISNLAYMSKIMEKAACSRLLTHCKMNNLQEVLQSAYKEGHSTETALVKVHNDILMALDKKKVVCLVLLDLSAAFDTVNHQILLHRLEHMLGLKEQALQWFESYLTGRDQRVVVKGETSKPFQLTCGVPQGSVLGPVLFTLYVSPLGDIVRKHGVEFHLYADDTQIYISLEPANPDNHTASFSQLNRCVHDISNWMKTNKLKLNDDKTEIIMFGTPKQLEKIHLETITIAGIELPIAKRARNLGVLMDANLTLAPHVSSITKTAHYHLRNLSCIRKYLDTPSAEKAVHAFVTSRLDCSNALLFGIRKNSLQKLQKVQNVAAKLVLQKRKYDHVTPLLVKLHWLPIHLRIEFKLLVLTFKCIHKLAPSYLSDMLHVREATYTTRSSHTLHLHVPRTHLKYAGDRAFSAAAPRLWNNIPVELRRIDSLSHFKTMLKTHLFSKAY